MRFYLLAQLTVLLFLCGCTDGLIGKIKSYGKGALIICYSGGKEIYKGESTGKVLSEQSSDGYYFVDKKSGAMMEIAADCVFKYSE
tara:strand:- start:416 stop:673 length:258 start_codon:yes stop_codon:yes gene_type:complete